MFQNEEDKEKILQGRTWSFDGQYLLLKQWDPNHMRFLEEEERVKLWVHILNLPLHWLSAEVGLKIGKSNLNEPILRGMNITLRQETHWVDFRYEGLLSFCFYCGRIGYGDRTCSVKKEDINRNMLKLGQFGDWLRTFGFSQGDSRMSWPSLGDKSGSDVKLSRTQANEHEINESEGKGHSVGTSSKSVTEGVKDLVVKSLDIPKEVVAVAAAHSNPLSPVVVDNEMLIDSSNISSPNNVDCTDLVEIKIAEFKPSVEMPKSRKGFKRQPRAVKVGLSDKLKISKKGIIINETNDSQLLKRNFETIGEDVIDSDNGSKRLKGDRCSNTQETLNEVQNYFDMLF
ncbi:Unknown protein [Striga hermonthica]|uniref:Zinc knuckle CX2CX4HX4C domain-containing protein n=1 Tax=Striga hermonthica TaxID=68872 RepID=A0A9N7MU84_STRHE|nr:Unknown protein [Striga hermonthica]